MITDAKSLSLNQSYPIHSQMRHPSRLIEIEPFQSLVVRPFLDKKNAVYIVRFLWGWLESVSKYLLGLLLDRLGRDDIWIDSLALYQK